MTQLPNTPKGSLRSNWRVSLIRFRVGRRTLLLNLMVAVPLFVFAIFLFDAGQIERYLPLYPTIFLALTFALCSEKVPPALTGFLIVYLGIATFTNLRAMSPRVLAGQQWAAEARTRNLKHLLDPSSLVFTSHCQDEMVLYKTNLLFVAPEQVDRMNCVVDPNTSQVPHWRQQFASEALAGWQNKIT